MQKRIADKKIHSLLTHFPVVGLLGARQVGKTTTAFSVSEEKPSVYLDLEDPSDLAKIEEPQTYFGMHSDKLIILDEVQRKPELFTILRGIIDEN